MRIFFGDFMGNKFMIASDLHGSIIALDKVIEIFDEIKADKLILLGDIFGSNANEMVEKLNQIYNRLTIVKGNNGWYFEPENAKFKLFNETYENINGQIAYLCHGHKLNDMFLSGYNAKIIMFGHVHRPILRKDGDIILLCPGSIACPRFGSEKTYAVIDDKKIRILTEQNELVDEFLF